MVHFPTNLQRFVKVIFLTTVLFAYVDSAFARGVDYDEIYGPDEGGTPDLVYLVIWGALCAAIASLYRLYDKLNGSHVERSEKIFEVVIIGSLAGAMYGFGITIGVVIVVMIADGIFNSNIGSFVFQKTNLIVLFFASVNVAGLMHVLRDTRGVIVQTKEIDIIYRYDDDQNDAQNSEEEQLSAPNKKIIQCKGCGHKLRIPSSKRGKVTCPKCSATWSI